MEAVHGRTHLGVEFTAAHVSESHCLYEQYLGALLHGTPVDNARYLEMTAPALPAVSVYVITDGKTKDGQMLPLLEQRRAEFDRLCGHIRALIEAPAADSPSGTPTASALPAVAAAGGGRATTFAALPEAGQVYRPAASSQAPPHAAPAAAPTVSASMEISTSAVMCADSAMLLVTPSTDATQTRDVTVFSSSSLEAGAVLPELNPTRAERAASAASSTAKHDILIGLALAITCFFAVSLVKRRH